jgi:hypothetical protein
MYENELIYEYLSYICKKKILDFEISSNVEDERYILIGSTITMSPKTFSVLKKTRLPQFYKKRKFKEQLDLL